MICLTHTTFLHDRWHHGLPYYQSSASSSPPSCCLQAVRRPLAVHCRAVAHDDVAGRESARISDEPVLRARNSKGAPAISGAGAKATVATRSASQQAGSELDEEAKTVSVMSGAWLSNHMKTWTVFGQGLGWAGIAVGAFFWIRWAPGARPSCGAAATAGIAACMVHHVLAHPVTNMLVVLVLAHLLLPLQEIGRAHV